VGEVELGSLPHNRPDGTLNIEVTPSIDRPCAKMLTKHGHRPSLEIGQDGGGTILVFLQAGIERGAVSRDSGAIAKKIDDRNRFRQPHVKS